LINTSIDQRNSTLSKDDISALERGGVMWEPNSTTQKNRFGLVGDLIRVFEALSGGAHIEKNQYGET
jgi:hypothetical protein